AHRVEEPEVVLLAGQRRRGAVAGEGRGEVGEVGGVGLRQREVLTRQVPPERLAPRPVRRGAGDLPAPSPQHPRARRRGARRELRDQPRLADTRIPGDDEETAVPLGGRGPGGPELAPLLDAADEEVRGTGAAHHPPSRRALVGAVAPSISAPHPTAGTGPGAHTLQLPPHGTVP